MLALALLLATDPLLTWMDGIAQKQLDQRQLEIAKVRTRDQAKRRAAVVREKILRSIGGLPATRTPLNAKVTGKLMNPSYTMEKVVFESLPHFYVTANLYLPKTPGRHPAVLVQAGHTTLGKTETHQLSANLAAKGFVALTFDPIGLGERIQALDPRTRRHAGGCCANEHLQAGAQAALIGESVARYFIWDAMRAIDYLETRPEVDPQRIGAAGCSGGGCLTTYIAALDPRIKAAAPACYTNSYRLLFSGPHPDSEMSLPGFLGSGLDHADLFEMAAPTPWLILATEGDYFTPPGAKMVYDEVRGWYGLFDAADRVKFFVGSGPHGTPHETRESIYEWMIRWLNDGKGEVKEGEVPLYPDSELQVTASGQVQDLPGSLKVHELIRARYRELRKPKAPAALLAELRRMVVGDSFGEPQTQYYAGHGGPALVVVNAALSAEQIEKLGVPAMAVTVRDSPASLDKRPYLANWLANTRAENIGLNLSAMRANDISKAVALLAAKPGVDPKRIRVLAKGVDGVWALMAAAVDQRIASVWIDKLPHDFQSALGQPLNTRLFDVLIPGFLLHWEMSDLIALMGKRPLVLTDPVDWNGMPVEATSPFRARLTGETIEELATR